ncbi:MAG: branched-chain amino acid ABC transporter permease [Atribacterota bacterium]|nr:branched-chain amino acid ABC transporter permease [Atribacterota bacterium]MDD5637555.1 branched-chain amino acid ABC transporter permease [Atribacterota bacterium]
MEYFKTIFIVGSINVVAVIGVTIFTGFTGLFSFGHAAFVAIGAYGAGILTYFYHFPFILAVIIGSMLAGLVSLIIGYPTIRGNLGSDYLAVALLGFGEAVRVILENLKITQGARGLPGIRICCNIPVVIITIIICIIVARNIIHSKYGRRMVVVREDAIAAEMLGVPLFKTKYFSFFTSALFCGLSGGLFAHFYGFIQPVMFTLEQSTQILASVVCGGIGSITGPIIATYIFVAIPEIFRFAKLWRLVFYGTVLVLTMIFRPSGLMGYQEITFNTFSTKYKQLIKWIKDNRNSRR